jgi:hydrogenase expression/formation protein HypE
VAEIVAEIVNDELLLLDAGSGGRASQRLITGLFFKYFANPALLCMDDAALFRLDGLVAMSTDGFTVTPLEFPGGDIGSLAVHGTVNDVSMLGAKPVFLSCAFILEEGLRLDLLERIVASMADAAQKAGVLIVTGDTKVVPKGAADKIFITTTGLGRVIAKNPPQGKNARPGDAVIISGSVGDHGLTILSRRENLEFAASLRSDSAGLGHMAESLITGIENIGGVAHVLRDPTRGGLASTLNEIAEQSGVRIEIDEADIPVQGAVRDGCAILGLDPLYLANEGKLICILPAEYAQKALEIIRSFPEGAEAAQIGEVKESAINARKGKVVLRTTLGGERLLSMLEGAQLPRIC